jgi:cell division protein ZapA
MTDKTISTTIAILGKPYPIKCLESELQGLQEAAQYLHDKMAEVQDAGKVINLERIAIIAALNIAHEFLQVDRQKSTIASRIQNHISHLHDKLDTAINKAFQTELVYSAE